MLALLACPAVGCCSHQAAVIGVVGPAEKLSDISYQDIAELRGQGFHNYSCNDKTMLTSNYYFCIRVVLASLVLEGQ